MAGTTAMLNPNKTEVIPDPETICPVAAQLPASIVREAKKKYPDGAVMLYVDTLAEAKAESDFAYTYANIRHCPKLYRLT